MSHVALIELAFKSIELMAEAAASLGGKLVCGQETYKWYGMWLNDYHANEAAVTQGVNPKTFGKCDHAIVFPGCQYEVGVIRNKDGSYKMIYDNYIGGGGLEKVCGKGLSKLTQNYGVKLGHQTLKKRGFKRKLKETTLPDGTIRLEALK